MAGEIGGGLLALTGGGTVLGLWAMAASAALITGGVGNALAGIYGATQVLMSSGSGGGGAPNATGANARGVSTAQKIAGKIPSRQKCFGRCSDFADALQKGLQKAGVSGTRIHIQVGKGITPYSNKFGALAERGRGHTAIRVGDTVFDNFRPEGVPYSEFIDDLGGADFFGTPFVKVIESVF